MTVSAAGLIIIGIVIALLIIQTNKPKLANSYNYSCHYQEGLTYARCVHATSPGHCCGYYDLKDKKIENGIVVNGTKDIRPSTCEGFKDGDEVYFDNKGNYIN